MTRRFAGVASALLAVAATLLLAGVDGSDGRFAGEDARLRAHFDRVGRILAARDVSRLAPEQRAARARHLRELSAYARRGAFPRHRGEARGRTPIFIDRDGNRCAMAHLIERDGDAGFVARVARTANLACIHDLAGDPELAAWLESAGLTVAEAAMIQPGYTPLYDDDGEDHVPSDDVMGYGTAIGIFMGGASIILNMSPDGRAWADRRSHAVLGTVTGVSLLGLGITDWSRDSHLRGPGYFALTVGAAALTLAQINWWSGPRPGESTGTGETTQGTASVAGLAEASGIGAGVQSPQAGIGLARGRDGEPQVAVHLRF